MPLSCAMRAVWSVRRQRWPVAGTDNQVSFRLQAHVHSATLSTFPVDRVGDNSGNIHVTN